MGKVQQMKGKTKELFEAIEVFEREAKKKGLNLTEEISSPGGYWYTTGETNTAFYWFLSGLSLGKIM